LSTTSAGVTDSPVLEGAKRTPAAAEWMPRRLAHIRQQSRHPAKQAWPACHPRPATTTGVLCVWPKVALSGWPQATYGTVAAVIGSLDGQRFSSDIAQEAPMTSMTAPASSPEVWHGTTILTVRKAGKVVIAGDGQVSFGATIIKSNAKKVRSLGK